MTRIPVGNDILGFDFYLGRIGWLEMLDSSTRSQMGLVYDLELL